MDSCDLAASIRLVDGAKWVPELLDHNTKEWQNLANEVYDEVRVVTVTMELVGTRPPL